MYTIKTDATNKIIVKKKKHTDVLRDYVYTVILRFHCVLLIINVIYSRYFRSQYFLNLAKEHTVELVPINPIYPVVSAHKKPKGNNKKILFN